MKQFFRDLKNIIKEDKKILFSFIVVLVFIISGGVLAVSFRPYDVDRDGTIDSYDYWLLNQGQKYLSNYSVKKSPQRIFTLDMKGIAIDGAIGDTDSKLREYNSLNKKIGEWKVDIAKKGHARGGCNPPMFNMSFDKFDSEGNPKPLFPGISTYGTNTTLQYQKVRAVENCDSFNDALSQYPYFGLNGAIPPQFREYIVYRTMRLLGVPSVEPVAFAKLNILNAEPKYSNTSYYYMFMQRDNELDDSLPFIRQFGLEDKLYEDGGSEWRSDYKDHNFFKDRLVDVNLINQRTGEKVKLDFNPEDSIRHFILTRFINDSDRAILHNEDYGKVVGSDKYRAILYGFDFSFTSCRAEYPSSINSYINNISPDLIPQFQHAYYKVAREIFTNNENLFKLLLAIDQYPNPVSSRSVIVAKKYLKLSFYEYAKYFNSKEFADSINQSYVPIKFIPVMNESAYSAMRSDFDTNLCKQELLPPPNPIINLSAEELDYSRIDQSLYNFKVKFDMGIEATDSDVIIPKTRAFSGVVVNEGVEKVGEVYLDSWSGDLIDLGSYYLLEKGSKASLLLRLEFYEDAASLSDKPYYAYLKTFRPGVNYDFIKLPLVKTEGLIVEKPECSENQTISGVSVALNTTKPKSIHIDWTYDRVLDFNVDLFNDHKELVRNIVSNFRLSDKNRSIDFVVDGVAPPGNYFVRVSSSCNPGVLRDSQIFNIDNGGPRIDISLDSIKANLAFDNFNQEASLDSSVTLHVKAIGSDVFFDDSNIGYVIYKRENNLEKYPQIYDYVQFNIVDISGFDVTNNKYKYVLKDGSTGVLKMKSSKNTNTMFSGSYRLGLAGFFGFDSSDNMIEAQLSSATSSNSVAIIGEKSPYLFPTRKEPFSLTDYIEISGERLGAFDKLQIIKKGDEKNPVILSLSSLGLYNDKFKINPSYLKMGVGDYSLQINGKRGNSNNISFTIIDNSPIAKKRILNMVASVWHAFSSFFEVKK